MTALRLIDVIPCANLLGEGVQWNPDDGSFWWTDVQQKILYRYTLAEKHLAHWNLPDKLCCFAFAKTDGRLLAAFAAGFAWFDLNTGAVEWIAQPEAGVEGNRSNDGRCDRQGRFWMGTVMEDPSVGPPSAGLYCLAPDFSVTCHLQGLSISNGLCWSPDGCSLYHTDSPSHRIYVYDFDPLTGTLANPRLFARTHAGVEPDGACVDTEGYVWSAQWGGGQVVRYSPAGDKDRMIDLPVSQPSCVAFGGEQLNLLAVTSARKGLSPEALAQQPEAGSLFIYETPFTGLEESRFG